MKNGFTMIELIFVIVISGILASIAISRLTSTREDAEISATVANLHTLLRDAASYYVAKESFADAKWKDFTNVPLQISKGQPITTNNEVTKDVHLAVGGLNCIAVRIADRSDNAPAHFIFGKDRNNKKEGVCKQVLEADAVKAYVEATIEGVKLGPGIGDGAIAIGSNSSVYTAPTTPAP
ncbi:type II secretion system protein [Campylobacter sp.]|uniref:type II secretion system protein n=1 Tax=Campylobacter sp. TaxID=205 RepID=UPI002AA7D2CE|nr:type II secretion system protein [Campylobacter sp.]MCI7237665.1 type II secretion system GspH family protein [Campylobacter sp.]